MMTEAQIQEKKVLQAKAEKAINALVNFIKADKLEILNKEYIVVRVGKWTMNLNGKKGAKYFVSACPLKTVRESNNLSVYHLYNHNTSIMFTLTPAGSVELHNDL